MTRRSSVSVSTSGSLHRLSTQNTQNDLIHQNTDYDQTISKILERKDIETYCTPLSSFKINVTKENKKSNNFEVHENIEWDDLQDLSHLADGGMCRVYTAKYNGTECVVKTPLPDDKIKNEAERADIQRSLQSELAVLQRVKYHPNIIAYYGSGTRQSGEIFILVEKLQGILSNVLQMHHDNLVRISVLDAVKWGAQISQAMTYLNDRAVDNAIVLHRDLKPDNIGFGADGNLKVFDFGLAVIVKRHFRRRSDEYHLDRAVGTLRYMAKENAKGLPYNEKADVHSFGLILWQMLTRKLPYSGCNIETFKHEAYALNKRPSIKKKWSSDIRTLLEDCWAVDGEERPAFREILGRMEGILMDEIQKVVCKPKGVLGHLKSAFLCRSCTSSLQVTESQSMISSKDDTPEFNISCIDHKIRERLAENALPSPSGTELDFFES